MAQKRTDGRTDGFCSWFLKQEREDLELTAFREYALSSASDRASTKSRRRLGRLACLFTLIYFGLYWQREVQIIFKVN